MDTDGFEHNRQLSFIRLVARPSDPVLPLSPGRAERHGFEYYRQGTLSLYGALNVKTGAVEGETARRHTSQEFVAFLTELAAKAKWAREIHIVLDNLPAHKTEAVEQFLADHPKVRFHFTPTYSSWLNQVEIWFAKIERDQTDALHSGLRQPRPSDPRDVHRSQTADCH